MQCLPTSNFALKLNKQKVKGLFCFDKAVKLKKAIFFDLVSGLMER
jgi:hypothetical protein